jgi:hypothetical protein
MNSTLNSLLTSCQMVLRISGVYLLSFCLISLYDESMPNLCSITSLGIPSISNICHAKTSRFFWSKVMSVSSYLASRHVLNQSFLSGLLGRLGLLSHQPPSSLRPLTDRWAAGSMPRCHMCPSVIPRVSNPHDYVNHMFKRP